MKYRKKPVAIEAVEWVGINANEVKGFCPTAKLDYRCGTVVKITIPTLEGDMTVSYGDYIIKGVNGEFYPCKPDIFLKTYEPVEESEECK